MRRLKNWLRELLRPIYAAFTYDMDMWWDDLTGLPTRPYLVKQLEILSRKLGRGVQDLTVLQIDLDHFKIVNDLFKSHDHGNFVIKSLAEKMRALLGPDDFVVRMGGDEFCMVLVDQGTKAFAYARALEIESVLRVEYAKLSLLPAEVLGVSIGGAWTDSYEMLVRYSHQSSNHHMLLVDWADRAAYLMKQVPQTEWTLYFYRPEQWQAELDRQQYLSGLVRAIQEQRFSVSYQPILNLSTNCFDSAEALFRPLGWNPELNLEEDIDAIEEMIGLHTMWEGVMHLVCGNLRSLLLVKPELRMHVNISELQLNSLDLQSTADAVLKGHGVAPERFVFEITERRGMAGNEVIANTMAALNRVGIGLVLDDWGKGKTSLDSLLQFPYFEGIKLDRFLVANLEDNATQVVTRHAIGMAHELGMKVTAEAVETPLQLEMVRQLGCDYAQGHFICPPTTQEVLADKMMRPAQF